MLAFLSIRPLIREYGLSQHTGFFYTFRLKDRHLAASTTESNGPGRCQKKFSLRHITTGRYKIMLYILRFVVFITIKSKLLYL